MRRRAGGPNRPRPNQFRDFNEVTRGAEKIDGPVHAAQDRRPPLRRDPARPVQPDLAGADHDRAGPGVCRHAGRRRRNRADLSPRGRPGAARQAQRPFHRSGRHSARQVGEAELHRFGPDGAADHRDEPDEGLGPHRLFRHLHDRFRPAQPGHDRPQPQPLEQGQRLPRQHGARGRNDLRQRRPATVYGGTRRRRRPPRNHRRHPLQPDEDPRFRLPTRAPPTIASATS